VAALTRDERLSVLELYQAVPALDRFATLLQRGVLLSLPEPKPLAEILERLPGFSRAYMEKEVQTILVNHSGCDDLDQLIDPGSIVALSAAMPGLAGAIFRRGGPHASLRSRTRTLRPTQTGSPWLTIKLFNRIAAHRGPELLAAGITMTGPVLARFFARQGARMGHLIRELRLDGVPLDPRSAGDQITAHKQICFQIREILS